jgi:hypothetical protein
MARFYLHFENQSDECYDGEGFDAVDEASAIELCRRAAADLVAEDIRQGWQPVAFRLFLDDAAGCHIAELVAGASVQLRLAPEE